MSKSKSKSNSDGGKIEFLHDIKETHIANGHKTVHEEHMVRGSRGVLIKYYSKDGDKKEKYVIILKDGGFLVKTQHGEEKSETTMSKEELSAFLKKTPALKFAVNLLKQLGGRRRKGSKKSSKRRSKKRSGGARKRRSSRKSKKSKKSRKSGGSRRRRSRKSGGSRRRKSRKSGGSRRRRSRKSNGGSKRRRSRKTSGGKRRRTKSKKTSRKRSRKSKK